MKLKQGIGHTISQKVGNNFAWIVIIVGIVALFLPASFSWIPSKSLNWLLGVVMFGMGLTLTFDDFKIVATKPLPVLIGFMLQFSVMPLVALLLVKLFNLPLEIAIGVILVGCCPGGPASNLITYLEKGDVALSVCITSVTTLCAPIVTPFLTWLLASESVSVDVWAMLLSVLEVVTLPIIIGLIVKRFYNTFCQKAIIWLPLLSTLAICTIVGIVISANAVRIFSCGLLILAVVVVHNVLGLAIGYIAGLLLRLDRPKRTAIAIEVGMQNSALASALANTHFAQYPLATIPGAIFSVWHNFSGSIFATMMRKKLSQKDASSVS